MCSFDPRRHEIRYCAETIVTFAQNGEDALIFRAFEGKRNGRFVDIGAGHPVADNVTMWFSMMGWTGLNIEPNPIMFKEIVKYRPTDTNLNLGVAEEAGQLPFFHVRQNEVGHGWGLSSFEASAKERALHLGLVVDTFPVKVTTLDQIVADHAVQDIDFLKIDVEGLEAAIIRSTDWSTFRPKLICVEAVYPNSAKPTWPAWEETLLSTGYRFAHFDGCNAYYVVNTEEEIFGQLSAGINCNDRIRRATVDDYPSPQEH